MQTTRHNLTFMITALLILVGALVCNVLVDPFAIHPSWSLDGMDEFRKRRSAIHRGDRVVRGGFDVHLVGTSRVANGIPIDHPIFSGRRAVNLGLRGLNRDELEMVTQLSCSVPTTRQLYLFLDFFSFDQRLQAHAMTQRSRFSRHYNAVDYHVDKWLSEATLRDSWEVILRSRQDKQRIAATADVKHIAVRSLRNYDRVYSKLRLAAPAPILREILANAAANDIEVQIVFLPVHVALLDVLRRAGLWETLENWKRDIVVAAEGRAKVWDFFDYSSRTTIRFDTVGGLQDLARGFIDLAHIRPELGMVVLDTIGGLTPSDGGANDFGRQVSAATVEEHLLRIRNDAETFEAEEQVFLEYVRQLGPS
ncbi:MAG: hypothetical protein AAF581_19935 [Planctomycetota bacterium]